MDTAARSSVNVHTRLLEAHKEFLKLLSIGLETINGSIDFWMESNNK